MYREHEAELQERVEKIPGCRMVRGGCDPEPGISCSGKEVTQDTFLQLMNAIREVKGDAEIKSLTVYETQLVEIDLSPFLKGHFQSFGISHNESLTTITGPPLEELTGPGQKINARNIDISFHPLMTDEGFGQTLQYFDADLASQLNMWGMKIQGSLRNQTLGDKDTDDAPEFLPGLSLMKNLFSLEFAMNEIARIGGGQFRKNNKLSFLNFSKNPLQQIGSNAFLFDTIDASDSYWNIDYRTLVLRLSDCHLVSGAFVHGEVEWTTQRPIHLQIDNNDLDFLAPSIFETLLNANPGNEVIASSNQLVVGDDRMKWLEDNKDKYAGKVDFEGFKKQ